MPVCLETSGQVIQVAAIQPADITTCTYAMLSGTEINNLIGLAAVNAQPYDAAAGAVIFSLMFTSTLTIYLVTLHYQIILDLVRGMRNS